MNRTRRWTFLAGLLATVPAFATTQEHAFPQEAGFVCPGGPTLRVVMAGRQAFVRSGNGPARLLMRMQADQLRYQSATELVTITKGGARWQHEGKDMLCLGAAAEPLPDGFKRDGETLVHHQSGMRFPPVVAGFVRDFGSTFDLVGNYVVVRYLRWLGDGVMEARVGLVHLEGMRANEHYAGFSSQVLADLGGGSRMNEGPVPVAGRMSAARGYGGSFVSTDGRRAAMLITVALGHWSARLRSEWPASAARDGRRQLGLFARSLDWTPALDAPVNPESD